MTFMTFNEAVNENFDKGSYYAVYDCKHDNFLFLSQVDLSMQYHNGPSATIMPESVNGSDMPTQVYAIIKRLPDDDGDLGQLIFIPITGFHDTYGPNLDWSGAFQI